MNSNYFVCTLGQAAHQGRASLHVKSISHLVERQSIRVPDCPAVAFTYPDSGDRSTCPIKVYSFHDVAVGTDYVARRLAETLPQTSPRSKTVALLCPSTPEFLFTWLALVSLGYSVLLVAPQCTSSAIYHLCTRCNAEVLFYDSMYAKNATEAFELSREAGETAFHSMRLPVLASDGGFTSALKKSVEVPPGLPGVEPTSTAYFFHTSGTSSGLPKPIPQSHHAAVRALPHFPGERHAATFSTTPLYHGGIADLFRAWTSDAMICLYPGKNEAGSAIPVTAKMILSSIDRVKVHATTLPPVKYFSSVPYVLQLVAAESEGLGILQSMDCVGVGGAALPNEIGISLVESCVNLVSRYGSAECGFVMSSHRAYERDKYWQYLRADNASKSLHFEACDDGRFELVVGPDWPHLVSTGSGSSNSR